LSELICAALHVSDEDRPIHKKVHSPHRQRPERRHHPAGRPYLGAAPQPARLLADRGQPRSRDGSLR
jgi:hypothetical protein